MPTQKGWESISLSLAFTKGRVGMCCLKTVVICFPSTIFGERVEIWKLSEWLWKKAGLGFLRISNSKMRFILSCMLSWETETSIAQSLMWWALYGYGSSFDMHIRHANVGLNYPKVPIATYCSPHCPLLSVVKEWQCFNYCFYIQFYWSFEI